MAQNHERGGGADGSPPGRDPTFTVHDLARYVGRTVTVTIDGEPCRCQVCAVGARGALLHPCNGADSVLVPVGAVSDIEQRAPAT